MKLSIIFLEVLCLASLSFARSNLNPRQISKNCQDYFIPLSVTSSVNITNYSHFENDLDVIAWIDNLDARVPPNNFVPFTGEAKSVNDQFSIGATICTPHGNSSNKPLLIATHGIGFDRKYWDSGFQPDNYSFVDFALQQGYSVFTYDRIGTGLSSKVSGYTAPQSSTQLVVLQQITKLLKSGKYTGSLGVPSKVVHVGHSYGSFLSNALLAATPDLSDGALLTGTAYGQPKNVFWASWSLRIASEQVSSKWVGRDSGYLTWVDEVANAATFFHGGSYDPKALQYSEENKQPLAAIELLTRGQLNLTSPDFTGPVMIISGEYDFAACAGNCDDILGNGTTMMFPKAKNLTSVVHPVVGHGINFSYNATGAYGVMLDYLNAHGL